MLLKEIVTFHLKTANIKINECLLYKSSFVHEPDDIFSF